MVDLPFFLDFSEPIAWLIILWGAIFAPALYVALWRSPDNENKHKNKMLRKAGFEISFVLVPFILYAVIYVFWNSLNALLISPELPMAGLILCFMSLRWVLIASKRSKGQLDQGKVRVLKIVISIIIAILLILIVQLVSFQLGSTETISPWYGVVNTSLFNISFYLAYGIIGAMMMYTELPNAIIFGDQKD
ncbi:hypothetical protein [Colwellia sp. 20A7]|uniref:hypothetical protein n=1 Tax=Colwellia sp. 20A7 TaxID=2689569 RepID=UPI0013599092|nr:hypothetical protein [Colwellia sp. 20A7]